MSDNMKKKIFLLSIAILALTTLKSQDKIQFGIKGGANFTNMTSDMTSEVLIEKEYKIGFHTGVLVEIPFGDKFSLQPEILYSTFGSKGKEILCGGPNITTEYKLDYIQVPILAKIYLYKGLSLEIGPSFNLLVNDKKIRESNTISDIGKKFEFSGILGVSYKLSSGLIGSFRYTNSFTNALNKDYFEINNYGFLVGIGYLF